MRLALLRRCVLVAILCTPLCAPAVRAQLPQNQETCTPYFTYTQLIRSLDEPMARIFVDDITFDGPTHLSPALREKAVAELTHRAFGNNSEFETDWLYKLREFWLDDGYFNVEATATREFLGKDDATQDIPHIRMIVHLNEGPQFRLGEVTFRGADPDERLAFPAEELRNSIPMKEADIFSAEKIRQALDTLKHLYNSRGYMDMVATPLTEIDADRQRISLIVEIDQQKQFRVASVEISGFAPEMETLLKSKLKLGDIYNHEIVEEFLQQNASSLPPYLNPTSIELHRNVKAGTVDFRLSVAPDCIYDD